MTRFRATPRSAVAAVALSVSLILPLAACGGSDSGGGGDTLTIWHYEDQEGALGKAWAAAIKKFKKTHPGVKVEFEHKTFDQIQQGGSMILNSDKAPDVLEYNKGDATAGLVAKQGLLTDLTQVAKERGWSSTISQGVSATARYDAEGHMNGDTWYGVPNYGEFVLAYYNQDLFAEHDVEVPTDFASFEAALEEFKDAGLTPLANAGNDHPASHWLYLLALQKADKQWVNDYQFFEGEIDFDGPEWTYAVNKYREWIDKGYFDKDDVGLKGTDMTEQFISGKRPILVGGNWWFGGFTTDIKDFEWSTARYPGSEMTLGSGGNMWVVPERSGSKDLAYDFIDITMSDEIQAMIGNEGNVPVAADPNAITNAKSRDVITAFAELQNSDNLAFYPDWPAAGYYDTFVAATQNLMGGSSPDDVLGELAAPYEKEAAARR